jgi:hypothetical protein
MNNADMPAMPQPIASNEDGFLDTEEYSTGNAGLTKREHFAGLAMQSVLNNFNVYEQGNFDSSDYKVTVQNAVGLADALLAELYKGRG